jgi:hypothetical protein
MAGEESGEFGLDSIRGEEHGKPIATLQRLSDLVMPLLGAEDVSPAVPDWYAVSHHYFSECCRETSIPIAM